MRTLVLSAILLMAVQLPCASQSQRQSLIDSLLLVLPNAKEDTNKVKLLNDLSYNYPYFNPDAGLKYGFEGLALAQKLGWTEGIAAAYYSIGGNYANKADYANALDYEYRSLKLYEQLNDRPKQALLLQNLGVVYHTSGNQEKALEYDNKALNMYKGLGNKEGVAAMYSNIANVYYSLGDHDKVIENNLMSLGLYRELNHNRGIARLLGNIANYYAESGEYNLSMPYYFEALRRETKLENKNGITRNMGNIGETYLDIARDTTGTVKADSLVPAGKAANLRLALEYLSTAINNAKELKQAEYILAFQEVLADAYILSGNYREAMKNYREYIAIRDSVYDVEKYNAATRRELDYEYGKREDSIKYEKRLTEVRLQEEQKSRNREKIFYSAGILLVLIFSVFMYNRWRVTRRQNKIIETERNRSEGLLLNILPSAVAEELKEKGSADARLFEDVTVMFTDFKNFTSITERLSPKELVDEIDANFKEFDRIIGKYNIEKIKTIGDSYMCAGGLPVPNSTNAVDVVSAALEIQNFMEQQAERRRMENKEIFDIRIGIHSGPVVAGIVGHKKFAYDIWGDTVNIASRMESSGEVGRVNISGATYELVKNRFHCIHRGKIDAKHKGQIDMYFVEKNDNGV